MRIVISQSMYFPWVGMFEQLRLADIFVRYDDVQFSKGSFTNRVQIKTGAGMRWLTIPLSDIHLGQRIDEVSLDRHRDWRRSHRDALVAAYRDADFCSEMLGVFDRAIETPHESLADAAFASMISIANYFDLLTNRQLVDSRGLNIAGSSTQRVLDIVKSLGGTTYITGLGAKRYLDHEAFERAGITVEYMSYQCRPYQQQHGAFTPYVSALDAVANLGKDAVGLICSTTIPWREALIPHLPGSGAGGP